MSQKKSKKQNNKTKSGSNGTKIFVGLIFLIAVVFFVYKFTSNSDEQAQSNNQLKNMSAIKFSKQGELTFNSGAGEYISQIEIEIAEDDQHRAEGLMFRVDMKENQGMLFIFPESRVQSFWMENTFISLDIIFTDADGKIVTIHKNTEPFSRKSIASDEPAKYVVEVLAGYTDMHKIKEGDKIVWRRI
jgi:uncharacterized membrane protein (UPF0127 family)